MRSSLYIVNISRPTDLIKKNIQLPQGILPKSSRERHSPGPRSSRTGDLAGPKASSELKMPSIHGPWMIHRRESPPHPQAKRPFPFQPVPPAHPSTGEKSQSIAGEETDFVDLWVLGPRKSAAGQSLEMEQYAAPKFDLIFLSIREHSRKRVSCCQAKKPVLHEDIDTGWPRL